MTNPLTAEEAKAQYILAAKRYEDEDYNGKARILLYGESGCGKTVASVLTSPRPVWVDSFDPKGDDGIRKEIKESNGGIIWNRYEYDDADSPTAYHAWQKDFEARLENGFFNFVGTYVQDSFTTFTAAAERAIANKALKKNEVSVKVPSLEGYNVENVLMKNIEMAKTRLPCHYILTAHEDMDIDDLTGERRASIATRPKLKRDIPVLFSEVWHMKATKIGGVFKHVIMVRDDGKYPAKTRAGRGKLTVENEPDIRKMLETCGLDFSDKEI